MASIEQESSASASSFSSSRAWCCGRWCCNATSLLTHLRSSLHYKQQLSSEASGALGDLGTFVPIAIALTLVNGLDLGTTLLFTGAYNIITGLLFGVPMPVQPMKSIAAVAISTSDPLTIPQIMAAGLSTAALLFFLGITGLMGFVQRILPLSVVRGVQLSQGISFGNTAVKYVLKKQDFSTGSSSGSRPWLGLDGMLLALIALLFIVVVTGSGDSIVETSVSGREENPDTIEDAGVQGSNDKEQKSVSLFERRMQAIPTAIIVFLVGVVLAFIRDPSIWSQLTLGPSVPQIVQISWDDWKTGFVRGAVPQIPLSILNSVIAVCKLSSDLFPDKIVTPTAVSTSVGLMNLVGCWFGAMPVCHGAGGLAGQCRFGATSGAAVVFLGAGKIILSLLVGSSLVEILSEFPVGLLGVLLLFSGVELAMACRDQNSRLGAFVMLVTTVVSLSSNAALGFGCGLVLFVLLKMRQMHYTSWWSRFRDTLMGSQNPAGYEACP